MDGLHLLILQLGYPCHSSLHHIFLFNVWVINTTGLDNLPIVLFTAGVADAVVTIGRNTNATMSFDFPSWNDGDENEIWYMCLVLVPN